MKHRFSFLLLALFLLIAGCGAPTVGDAGTGQLFFAMDTVMSITVHGDNGENAVQSARSEIDRLEKVLSRTRPESQISQLNLHAGDETEVALEPALIDLLQFSQTIGTETGGALDITIAPIMDAWGFTSDQHRVPSQSELDALLPLVDAEKLTLDAVTHSAQLTERGMEVDLGAVAKGFAASRATDAIRAAGADSALLDLGGNITALGVRPDGNAWHIAVKDPQSTDDYLCIIPLCDQTSSTSGGYERYFEKNGVRYHHIIDPKTGYPADTGLLSVTVVSTNHTLADALSTALFVLGPDKALDYWRQRDDFDLILCRSDNTILVTEGLESGFEFRGEANGYTYEIVRR